jgi:hypothetical protein
MVVENPTWGAPRIHVELCLLDFHLSERVISRWLKRAARDPDLAKRGLAFLRNHRGDRSGESHKDHSQANFIPESMAERHRGRVGGSCRRDLPDHVIVLNEPHVNKLLSEYVRYYHENRTRLGLHKGTPLGRAVTMANAQPRIVSRPRLGSLHHRYDLAA